MGHETYTIRPLEWVQVNDIEDDEWWRADAVWAEANVINFRHAWQFSYSMSDREEGCEDFATKEEAMARAEQWYRDKAMLVLNLASMVADHGKGQQ